MDCGPPGSSLHVISQARILEWVAISFSRGSSQPRDQTEVSCIFCIAGGFFTMEPPGIMNCFYQFWIWWDSAEICVPRIQPSQPTLQTGLSEESNLSPAVNSSLHTFFFFKVFCDALMKGDICNTFFSLLNNCMEFTKEIPQPQTYSKDKIKGNKLWHIINKQKKIYY